MDRTISHYTILEKLGEGGMGEVYLAQDTKLKRQVALKFLPRQMTADNEAKERFEREAQAAAALNHPNIVTIHEIGEHEGQVFIAMEYVEGQTLKDMISGVGARPHAGTSRDAPSSGDLSLPITHHPLPITQVIDIASQIASGLSAAHAKGIVHRDIKPQNILVDKDDHVKILDFGLAKLRGVSPLTKESSTLGTVHYMSPEQTMGKDVDQRSDIWSLGVVFYEMLIGTPPFKGEYEQAVIYAILNENLPTTELERLGAMPTLAKIVGRCLEKDPNQRFQRADEILFELKDLVKETKPSTLVRKKKAKMPLFIGAGISMVALAVAAYLFLLPKHVPAGEKSIAVLPFVDMSPQQDQEYFCDGMTEELINRLTNIQGLKVTARTSVFSFKGKADDIREIGKKLDVQNILEGSIKKQGNQLRITVQLVNVSDSFHIWSQTFDKELTKVFDIQDEIALAVADKLKLTLLADEKTKLARRPTENLESYESYLQGQFLLNRGTPFFHEAERYFNQAIQLDPQNALGYVGLAVLYTSMGEGGADPNEVIPKAREAAFKALKIDNNLAEAYLAMAYIKGQYDWDWSGAEDDFHQALKINPNSAGVCWEYTYYLCKFKRYDEAFEWFKRGKELDPLSPGPLGEILYSTRRYGEAIEFFKNFLKMDPDNDTVHWHLWLLCVNMGKDEETLKEMEKLMEIGGFPGWRANPEEMKEFGIICQKKGWKGGLEWNLERMMQRSKTEYVSPWLIALFHVVLGHKGAAIQWFEKAYEKRDMLMPYLNHEPLLDSIRDDPRFQEILKKMGFKK